MMPDPPAPHHAATCHWGYCDRCCTFGTVFYGVERLSMDEERPCSCPCHGRSAPHPAAPLSADERAAIQDVLAVGGSPQSQALRRYEATVQALEQERDDARRELAAERVAVALVLSRAEFDCVALEEQCAGLEQALREIAGSALRCADPNCWPLMTIARRALGLPPLEEE